MTPNKEDYLKCIYEIGSRHKKITNKEIAQLMQVSPPAVTEWWKKMLAEELLVKDKKSRLPADWFGAKVSFWPLSQAPADWGLSGQPSRLLDWWNPWGSRSPRAHCFWAFRWASGCHAPVPQDLSSRRHYPSQGWASGRRNQLTLEEASAPGDFIIKRVHDDFDLLKYLEKYTCKSAKPSPSSNTILSLRSIFSRQKPKKSKSILWLPSRFMWKNYKQNPVRTF